jgi:5,10-methylene-tetrahydrofolate dehydrogenase/methenyl tetrahydrofolate cyclohydrolase
MGEEPRQTIVTPRRRDVGPMTMTALLQNTRQGFETRMGV